MSSEHKEGELLDGRRRRWQEHNQVRRQVIIDAAIAVLERQPPGDEFQVQAVADEASMSRTVIYRHFEDRADLDRAVQRQICEQVGAVLLPALSYDIGRRIWTPSRMAKSDPASVPGPAKVLDPIG